MGLGKLVFDAIDVLWKFNQNGYTDRYKNVVDIIENQRYSNKHEDCTVNFHLRKDYDKSKKNAAIVFIHGGGFVAGDKKYRKRYCNFLANMGFFVINVNYPLCPKYKFHEQVPNFANLCKWVGDQAKEWGYDPMNMVVSGDSGGGHCSAVISAMQTDPQYCAKFNCEFPKNIKFTHALLLCGAYDVEKLFGKSILRTSEEIIGYITGLNFKGKKVPYVKEYEYYNELNVINYINKDFPKIFLTHVKDDIFCLNQGDYLIEKLKKYNVPYTEFKASRKGDLHDFQLDFKKKSSKEANSAIEEWLRAEFKDYNLAPKNNIYKSKM